jgi:hypothetical protein
MDFNIDIERFAERFASDIPFNLDIAGIFFHEARRRFEAGCLSLALLNEELPLHDERISRATTIVPDDEGLEHEDAWTDVIQGVGGLEPVIGEVIRDFAVGQILVVTAAEAYANAIARHSLGRSAVEQFDKLSPVGKWLFLPNILGIAWKPDLGSKPMQEFAELVARRNNLIHPKEIRLKGILDIRGFLKRVGADPDVASRDLGCVEGMIREFSLSWKGSYGPDWLQADRAQDRPPCFFGGDIKTSFRLGTPGEQG